MTDYCVRLEWFLLTGQCLRQHRFTNTGRACRKPERAITGRNTTNEMLIGVSCLTYEEDPARNPRADTFILGWVLQIVNQLHQLLFRRVNPDHVGKPDTCQA
jgi:hypothetical protein